MTTAGRHCTTGGASSSTPISTYGYQARTLAQLQARIGTAQLILSSCDLTSESECRKLIQSATRLSPVGIIGGVFFCTPDCEINYAGARIFDIFQHTQTDLATCFPSTSYFVIFSSIVPGLNGGQTAWSLAACETLCEQRYHDISRHDKSSTPRYHALHVQWGRIELPYEAVSYLHYSLPQSVRSCLNTFERIFLQTNTTPCWFSNVPVPFGDRPRVDIAQKERQRVMLLQQSSKPSSLRQSEHTNMIDMLCKQTKSEADYPIETSSIMDRLDNFSLHTQSINFETPKFVGPIVRHSKPLIAQGQQQNLIQSLIPIEKNIPSVQPAVLPRATSTSFMNKKINFLMPTKTIEQLNHFTESSKTVTPLFIVHPIEGHVNMIRSWSRQLSVPTYGIQYTDEAMQYENVKLLASFYWQRIESVLAIDATTYFPIHLCGLSFGAAIAYEMALQRPEWVSTLCVLDNGTTPIQIQQGSQSLSTSIVEFEGDALFTFVQQYANPQQQQLSTCRRQFTDAVRVLPDIQSRVSYAVRHLIANTAFTFDSFDLELAARAYIIKQLMWQAYTPSAGFHRQLPVCELLLVKACNHPSSTIGEEIAQLFDGNVLLHVLDTDRRSFLETECGSRVADILNEYYLLN
jgi:hypothetical protein